MYFSIVMPIYNAEKYMEKAINSVLMQNYSDFELILVDDGSTDESGKIADKFSEKDSRVVVLHQKNFGPATARNNGILNVEGEYLLFIDADDEFEQCAFKSIYENMKKEPVDFLCFGYKTVKKNLQKENAIDLKPKYRLYKTTEEILKEQLSIINSFFFNAVWNKAYKVSIIKGNNIFMRDDLYIGEDLCFNLEVLEKAKSYCEFDTSLYKYIVQNPNSICMRYDQNKFEQMLKVHCFRSDCLTGNRFIPSEQINAEIHYDYARMCFSCFMDMFRNERSWPLKKKINYIGELKKYNRYIYSNHEYKYLTIEKKIPYIAFMFNNRYILYFFSYLFYLLKFKLKLYKKA